MRFGPGQLESKGGRGNLAQFFKGTVHLFHINCIKTNLISYIKNIYNQKVKFKLAISNH
jgi:hypothetical protein